MLQSLSYVNRDPSQPRIRHTLFSFIWELAIKPNWTFLLSDSIQTWLIWLTHVNVNSCLHIHCRYKHTCVKFGFVPDCTSIPLNHIPLVSDKKTKTPSRGHKANQQCPEPSLMLISVCSWGGISAKLDVLWHCIVDVIKWNRAIASFSTTHLGRKLTKSADVNGDFSLKLP